MKEVLDVFPTAQQRNGNRRPVVLLATLDVKNKKKETDVLHAMVSNIQVPELRDYKSRRNPEKSK